ncbi:uncharacterized protein LOC117329267 [Pecten maximus]|uniref:uncharacterized protein LOC117329267 n=1 Tax=Pecten maximus TaxID=6579 RepID=UPI00145809FD|nr:uncharacterized protein LOC117329267 [Pecten maximus]
MEQGRTMINWIGKHEEKMDRIELERSLKPLSFTFKSNDFKKETTEEKVDALIDKVLTDAVNKKVGIIVVMISSHGEEVLEQSENNKNKNILRHRILLEDKCLYTDDLLKKFETKKQLKGIPKLFFIQACRSRVTADREDRVDKGVELLVAASGTENGEITKLIKTDRSLPDARPRNLNKLQKPAVQSGPPVKPEDTKPHMDESEVRNKKTDQIQTRPNVEQTIHEADAGSRKPPDETTVEPIPQVEEEIPSISCIEDSLVMFASAPGKEAYRLSYKGGWLMKTLCESLKDWKSNPDQDLLQVLTGVIGKLAIEKETDEGYKSAACFTHMLTKDIYLCPGK